MSDAQIAAFAGASLRAFARRLQASLRSTAPDAFADRSIEALDEAILGAIREALAMGLSAELELGSYVDCRLLFGIDPSDPEILAAIARDADPGWKLLEIERIALARRWASCAT